MNDAPHGLVGHVDGRRLRRLALALAIASVAALALGWSLEPDRVRRAYLAAFVATTTIGVGALALLMIVHLMNAAWPVVVRRVLEGMTLALLPCALAFLPIVAWTTELYPWARPLPADAPSQLRDVLEHQRAWFDARAFWLRSALYLATFSLAAMLLCRWSFRQDRDPTSSSPHRPRTMSAVLLPPVAFALTFAMFDWVMSLQPGWFSSAFGLYLFSGGFAGAIALLVICVATLDRPGALATLVHAPHYRALGKLALAATALWTWIAFFQLLVIWSANVPREVAWYAARLHGGWRGLALAVIVCHFCVPVVALLSYRLKERRRPLCAVAAVLLLGHILHVYWVVVGGGEDTRPLHWIDLAALVLFAGAGTAFVADRLHGRLVASARDPRFEAGVRTT